MPKRISCIVLTAAVILCFAGRVFPADASGRAYYDLGVFAYEDGDYEAAESNFRRAAALEPDRPDYLHYLGKTLLKKKEYREAGRRLAKAFQMDPAVPGLMFDLALFHYETEDYEVASELFSEVSDRDPDNEAAIYFIGLCLFKEERYHGSARYFSQVEWRSPVYESLAAYYSGVSQVKIGGLDEAERKFNHVLKSGTSEKLVKHAGRWLKAIEMIRDSRRPYSLYASVGYVYDDNIRLEPLDEDIYTDEADGFLRAYLSGSYHFINHDRFKLGAGYSHYQTVHQELSEYDLMGSIGGIYTKLNFHPYSIGLSYAPSYYRLDGESYLLRHKISPVLTMIVDQKSIAALSYGYSINDYDKDSNDGDSHELLFDWAASFADGQIKISWTIGYEDVDSDNTDREYEQLKTGLKTVFRLPLDIFFGLEGKYYNRRYDHVDSTALFKRRDLKYYGGASISRSLFFEWLDLKLEADYTKNDANHLSYDYEKTAVSAFLEAKY